nr:ribosomal protein S3 [Fissidens protonematicola]
MAQKINPISVRLNLNRSLDSSWFSDYYYKKLLYQDVNFRDYFDLIRPPTGKTFGFRLGKFIIHHFPKRAFIHVFFLDRLSRSKHTIGLGAIQSVKLIKRIDNVTEIQQNEVKIRRYGYDDRLPSMHTIDQLLRMSGWMVSKNSTSLRNDALLENDDRTMSEKSYAFYRFGSLRQISDVFPQTIFAAVRAPLNHLVMQYFFHLKNRIQFDPIVNIISDLVARSLIERYMTKEAEKREDSLKEKMHSMLLNKSICSKKESLTYMDKSAQGVPLVNNYIIKSTKPIRQPWSILNFGAPFILRDAEWKKVHSLFSRYYYWKKMQFFLSNQTKTNTLIRPVKIASIYQSASLIAQEISWKLEQKKSFRQICRSTFQEIEKCQYVKGMRICCSGRLNGAEIAKTECRKYGETSLHVFSDQIDYAKAQASTPYGILGVKVWVSYF